MASMPLITAILSHLIIIIIISSFTFLSASSLSNSTTEFNNGVTAAAIRNQRDFDYFVLALQWPGTYCQRTRTCCHTNACCRSSNSLAEFTIHGLWPNYNDGSWPSCCSDSNFDMKQISTLRSALDKHWPSLSCSSSSTCHGHKGSFYAHEWEKHGTCSSPVIRGEYNYFLTTLNLYFKYNVTKVLSEAGYVPSNSEKYPLGGIITAVENAFHTSPFIICSDGAVQELRLCFYKDFKPRDCVTTTGVIEEVTSSRTSCPKYVSMPTYASTGRLIKVGSKGWILALFVVITICLL